MLVLDNRDDQDFIEKVLLRLNYTVISLKKGSNLSEQLIEHFPDVVFASMLGRNIKMLTALGKIKQARGKPLLVFVKQPKESGSLTEKQKEILDGMIYSPIDPFKVIDVLSNIFAIDKIQLRRKYNEKLNEEREASRNRVTGEGQNGEDDPNFHALADDDQGPIEEGDEGYGSVNSPSSPKIKKSQNYGKTDVLGGSNKSEALDSDFGGVQQMGNAGQKAKSHEPKEADVASFMEELSQSESEEGPDSSEKKQDMQDAGAATLKGLLADDESSDMESEKSVDSSEAESSPEEDTFTIGEKGTFSDGPEEKASHSSSHLPHHSEIPSELVNDSARKDKYAAIVKDLEASGERPEPIDAKKLRQLQKDQAAELQEDGTVRKNRKHFLKTLFTMPINKK